MKKGFTLIELLLVVIIIGIITAIALPRFGDVKGEAYMATAQSDLKTLATQQELNFTRNNAYIAVAKTATAGAPVPGLNFTASAGVRLRSALATTGVGHGSTTYHTAIGDSVTVGERTGARCIVYGDTAGLGAGAFLTATQAPQSVQRCAFTDN